MPITCMRYVYLYVDLPHRPTLPFVARERPAVTQHVLLIYRVGPSIGYSQGEVMCIDNWNTLVNTLLER